jgi:hypothetical protein
VFKSLLKAYKSKYTKENKKRKIRKEKNAKNPTGPAHVDRPKPHPLFFFLRRQHKGTVRYLEAIAVHFSLLPHQL